MLVQGKAQHIDYFHHSSGDRKPKTRVVTVEDVEGSTSSAEEEEEEDKEVVREQVGGEWDVHWNCSGHSILPVAWVSLG
jgi:hypothetical protein